MNRAVDVLVRLAILLAGCATVVACMQTGQPLIAERSPVLSDTNQREYVVQPGDTLYSVAWRFDLDYQGLARANGISSPYVIRVGQALRLRTQLPTGSRIAQPEPNTSRAGKTVAKTPARETSRAGTSSSRTSGSARETRVDESNLSWVWPLDVAPVVEYGRNSKGMDFRLAGDSGRAKSAAAGEVVYAGSGIGGFERLVIVKHNQTLLSAYGFDGELSVREQQRIKKGREIGRIKRRGGSQFALHFELRRNGQPINPRAVLN